MISWKYLTSLLSHFSVVSFHEYPRQQTTFPPTLIWHDNSGYNSKYFKEKKTLKKVFKNILTLYTSDLISIEAYQIKKTPIENIPSSVHEDYQETTLFHYNSFTCIKPHLFFPDIYICTINKTSLSNFEIMHNLVCVNSHVTWWTKRHISGGMKPFPRSRISTAVWLGQMKIIIYMIRRVSYLFGRINNLFRRTRICSDDLAICSSRWIICSDE